jgi:hypothetical protein
MRESGLMDAVDRRDRWSLVAVGVLALGARLAVLPFATSDGGDAPSKVWMGSEWLSHPQLVTHGVWGPLHTYLIAFALWIAPDPVRAPVVMSLMFSVASAVAMYWFLRTEFESRRAALLVGLTYAVYPIAIRNGVSVRSETPFAFFLLLGMIALARLRARRSSIGLAAAAGLCLTLASMLRYEAWMLIPIFALLLPRSPRLLAIFLACALLHPIFWMIGNWFHNGDPFNGITAAANWELESMGRAKLDHRLLFFRSITYPLVVLKGMSLPIGLICVAGAAVALVKRLRCAAWLLPLAGVLLMWCLGIARGALVPKFNYTEAAGTLLFPFAAVAYQQLRIDAWEARKLFVAALVLPLISLVFACGPCLAPLRLERLAGFSPIPRIENQPVALALAEFLRADLPADESLVSDHYAWGASRYLALLTKLPRRRIYLVPGAPNEPIDADSLAAFLTEHPRGILIAMTGSRFTTLLDLKGDTTNVVVKGVGLRIVLLHSTIWPARTKPGMVKVFRYSSVD